MQNVLVIGGSYFVGRVFVEELIKSYACSLYVLNRGNIPLKKPSVREIKCDRHDVDQMRRCIPQLHWHAVIDFCAYTPEDIEGAISVLPQGKVGHYIYVSTSSVYAKTNDLPVSEESPKREGPQPELGGFADYAYNKWRAEIRLEQMCRERGIPYTALRPAFIYGKYNYAPRESYFFDLIIQNRTVALPEEQLALFSFVSVWDVARILIRSMGNEKMYGKGFNAAAEELVSYPRLIEVLGIVTGKNVQTTTMSTKEINEQQIPLPFPLDEHLIYSGSYLQKILDFRYTPFIDGMKETYRCYLVGKGLNA